ncbi:MAG: sigma-70 family RNA polymerase sigma factor [Bacillota bacterium]|nr:sigma-70 family RNA polymerase sigma factor [Bacillota bacterium]
MDALDTRGVQVDGAAACWDKIVSEHQRHISRLAWHLSGDLHEAQDLAQETFARAFEHRARFRGEASIKTWLSRITVNTYLLRLRKVKRLREVALDTLSVADSSRDPEQIVIRREFYECVYWILQNICRPSERVVLVLRDLDGMRYDDMSKVLGVSVPAIKSRLHRARQAFRQHLCGAGCAGLLPDHTCICEGVREI